MYIYIFIIYPKPYSDQGPNGGMNSDGLSALIVHIQAPLKNIQG